MAKENTYTREEIGIYLKFLKQVRLNIKNYNKISRIKQKVPNISENATESLACLLIEDGTILSSQVGPVFSIGRYGKNGNDIIVNGDKKIEVKATTSDTGLITTSEGNYNCLAWMWFNFYPFFENDNDIIPIHIINNPKNCLNPWIIKANGEYKMNIKSAIKSAKYTRNYELFELSVSSLDLYINNNINKFF